MVTTSLKFEPTLIRRYFFTLNLKTVVYCMFTPCLCTVYYLVRIVYLMTISVCVAFLSTFGECQLVIHTPSSLENYYVAGPLAILPLQYNVSAFLSTIDNELCTGASIRTIQRINNTIVMVDPSIGMSILPVDDRQQLVELIQQKPPNDCYRIHIFKQRVTYSTMIWCGRNDNA